MMNKSDSNVIVDTPVDKIRKSVSTRDFTLADYQYQKIMESIYEFEQNLDKNKEVALYLTNFGESVLMNITDIGYSNPSLIHYFGYIDGNYSELIQHVSQINFLITATEKTEEERPARRIGFKHNVDKEDKDDEKKDKKELEIFNPEDYEDVEEYEDVVRPKRNSF